MLWLIWRDILMATRAGGGAAMALAFFLILVLFVPLGIGTDPLLLSRIAPGIIWMGALLACLLSLERIFQLDFEDGTLDALMTSPLPIEGITALKAFSHWLTTGLPLTLIAPLLAYLLQLPSSGYLWLFLSLLLGTPGLSFLGMFGAALTVGVKRGGLLLSLIVLPLYIPTLIMGAQCVIRATSGLDPLPALAMTAGLSLFTMALTPFTAGLALRAATR